MTNNHNNWKEAFNKNFPAYLSDMSPSGKVVPVYNGYWKFESESHTLPQDIEDFIEILLTSQKDRFKKMVEAKKKEIPLELTPEEYEDVKLFNSVYNQPLKDILTDIENL